MVAASTFLKMAENFSRGTSNRRLLLVVLYVICIANLCFICLCSRKFYIKRPFTYDVSSRGGGGFKMLTVADKGVGGGLSLADVSKNTLILAKIVSNQAGLSLCVRLLH